MLTTGTLLVWGVAGCAAYAVWHLIGKRLLSAEARERRRRRRNHGRTISRRRGPAVKLAVKVDRSSD